MVADLAAAELDRVHERIAGRFARSEPRARVREYVSGLVVALERKNGWTLAERAGEISPDGMQRLLRRADWDADGVRDDVRDYVIESLGDRDGVLIGMLPAGQRRGWARPLPGPLLAGLSCRHHPLNAGPGLARRDPRTRGKREQASATRA